MRNVLGKHNLLRVALVLLALFLSSAYFIFGQFHQVRNHSYTGIRSINASDFNVNLNWIEQSRKGEFVFKNMFTSTPHQGFLIRPVYSLMSQPFRFTSISNSMVLHIQRILCGLVLLLLLFPLIHSYTGDYKRTNIAFALLVFTCGVGFLVRNWISQAADFDVPEAMLFITLGEPPHFQYSLLFLLAGATSFYLVGSRGKQMLLLYFICLAVLWWEHPFDAVVLIAITLASVWQLPGWKLRTLAIAGAATVSLPPALYYQGLQAIPEFSGWAEQNRMLSPSLPALLTAILPLLIAAIPGAITLKNADEGKKPFWFLITWISVQIILIYLPVPFQRRLISGIQFPLAILAAYGLANPRRIAVVVCFIAIFSAGNLVMTGEQIRDIKSGQMPYYLPDSYRKAFDWLANQKQEGAVLSGFITGNFIPGYAGFPVFIGHSALTPQISSKRKAVAAFYQQPQDLFLLENNIQYVFWGLEEKHLSQVQLDLIYESAFETDGIYILRTARKQDEPSIAKGAQASCLHRGSRTSSPRP